MTPPPAERIPRIVLRPIGSALPLGFVALGAASVELSGLQLGWLPATESHQAALVLLLFVAPLQFLSSVFGFLARDSVGGTGMGMLAGTWLATGAVLASIRAGETSRTLGLLVLFAAAALAIPAAAATLGKVLAAAVMGAAGIRFALTGVYELVRTTGWERVSGWWGIGLCVLALYAAFAFEIEDSCRRTVLPVGRRGEGKRTLEGSVAEEIDKVQREAGVREQL